MKHETSDASVDGTAGGVLPVDAVLGLLLLGLVDAAVLLLPAGDPARVAAALPLLLFLPGYALLSTMFPRQGPTTGTPTARRLGGSLGLRARLDWLERLGLSVAVSLSLLPVLGVGLSLAGLGLTGGNVVTGLSALVVFGLIGGAVRRASLPAEEVYRLPVGDVGSWAYAEFAQRPAVDVGLNLALAAVVLVSLVGVGYAFIAPPAPAPASTVSVLAPDGQGGYHAAGYPQSISGGANLAVAIDNDGRTATQYTVVAELQRVERADSSVRVLERSRVGTWQPTVEAGGQWQQPHTVQPELQGSDLRLIYYVYEGDTAPGRPTVGSADKTVHLWVDA